MLPCLRGDHTLAVCAIVAQSLLQVLLFLIFLISASISWSQSAAQNAKLVETQCVVLNNTVDSSACWPLIAGSSCTLYSYATWSYNITLPAGPLGDCARTNNSSGGGKHNNFALPCPGALQTHFYQETVDEEDGVGSNDVLDTAQSMENDLLQVQTSYNLYRKDELLISAQYFPVGRHETCWYDRTNYGRVLFEDYSQELLLAKALTITVIAFFVAPSLACCALLLCEKQVHAFLRLARGLFCCPCELHARRIERAKQKQLAAAREDRKSVV